MRNFPTRLVVRAGQFISIGTWNLFAVWNRGCRLIAGRGVRLDTSADGTVIHFDAGATSFLHPFKCSLLADASGVVIRRGLVNGKAVLNSDGKPLDAELRNEFTFDGEPQVGADNRGWVAVEAVFDEKWGVDQARLVQVADLDTPDGKPPKTPVNGYQGGGTLTLPPLQGSILGPRARWPITELIRRDSGQFVLQQVARFDLMHRASIPVQANGKPGTSGRHFFYAAT